MKKILIILLFIGLCFNAHAGTISRPTTYATGSEVNATNLNNNFDTAYNVINGGLDNDNADTADGYRFFEVLGALPAAGTEGRVVFLTTDDTINIDNGTAFTKAISVTGTAQGDIIYYSGSAWTVLAAGTAGRFLQTGGSASNPHWEVERKFESWQAKAQSTIHTALTDGFVIVTGSGGSGWTVFIKSDPFTPPTTVRAQFVDPDTSSFGLTVPVPRGHYYQTDDDGQNTYWMPADHN